MIDALRTDRLVIRPLQRSDVDHLVELDGDADVMRYITGQASPPEAVQSELEATLGTRWLVFDEANTFLGWVGAVPNADRTEHDIGWRFRRSAWGNGFATEAAAALLDALFADGAARVFAQTMAVNHPSRSVMTRIGLRYVRTFHLHFDDPLPGTELGEVEYEMTRAAWSNGSATSVPNSG